MAMDGRRLGRRRANGSTGRTPGRYVRLLGHLHEIINVVQTRNSFYYTVCGYVTKHAPQRG